MFEPVVGVWLSMLKDSNYWMLAIACRSHFLRFVPSCPTCLSPADISKLGRRKGKNKFILVYRLQSCGNQQQKLQGEKLDPGTQEESTRKWSIGVHCLDCFLCFSQFPYLYILGLPAQGWHPLQWIGLSFVKKSPTDVSDGGSLSFDGFSSQICRVDKTKQYIS